MKQFMSIIQTISAKIIQINADPVERKRFLHQT